MFYKIIRLKIKHRLACTKFTIIPSYISEWLTCNCKWGRLRCGCGSVRVKYKVMDLDGCFGWIRYQHSAVHENGAETTRTDARQI